MMGPPRKPIDSEETKSPPKDPNQDGQVAINYRMGLYKGKAAPDTKRQSRSRPMSFLRDKDGMRGAFIARFAT